MVCFNILRLKIFDTVNLKAIYEVTLIGQLYHSSFIFLLLDLFRYLLVVFSFIIKLYDLNYLN